ncbi:MAG: gliding motility-associated C-terminal domain-containing protein [Lewinellaceae bacterium]|nr:gliding motility-associated C-terminal domain-containing protein [Lewinellaceae bacterium]
MKYGYSLLLFFIVCLQWLLPEAVQAQCSTTVYAGEDVYVCAPPTPTQLNGDITGDYLSFNWSPLIGMSGSNTLTPTVNVNQTTTYVLTVNSVDLNNNQIINGDFEGGAFGFTSDYLYSPGDLWPEGVYDVITNPQDDHPNFAPCEDHTSGSGNMMVVNGAGIPNQNVWCQTVPVTPNTQYVFSAWVTSVISTSPAILQFSINGQPIGPIYGAPGTTCLWTNFYTTWNSGGNASATICIVNMNTALSGNDFALDDIVFAPVCQSTDSVTVNVVNIQAAAAPAVSFIPCNGAEITLSGQGSSVGPDISYNWDTPNGNIISGENTLSPVVNAAGTYTLTVTFDNGFVSCTKTATVNVVESPSQLAAWINPTPPLGCGSNTATLIGNSTQPGFSTYEWTAGPGGNIVSGANSKIAMVDEPATYTLLVTNTATGCTATAEVTVTETTNPPAAIASVADTLSCIFPEVTLSGAGSASGSNISYAWTTPNGVIVSGQNTQNAVAGAGGTYILTVTNTSNNCSSADTITVAADTVSPQVNIMPPGMLDCDTDTLTLSATVSPANVPVLWGSFGPGNIVSGADSTVAQVTTTGLYNITATSPQNGCTNTASVVVSANYTPPLAVVQPADSITCQFPSVILSGNGSSTGPGFTYQWTYSPGGNIVSGADSLAPVVNAPGDYILIVTNIANACTASDTLTVVADTNLVVAIANAPDTLTCTVNATTLNADGSTSGPSITYLWSTMNGNITGGGDTPNPDVDLPGTYSLLLTNTSNGCTATDLAVVAQNTAPPDVQLTSPPQLTCTNPIQAIQGQNLSLPGNFAYAWTVPPGGNIVSGDSTLTPSVNAPGLYILATTNLLNGCVSYDSVMVALAAGTPVAVASTPGPLTCLVANLVLDAAGSSTGPDYTYGWSTPNGNITGGDDTPSPGIDQPGTYNLLITNTSNGCTATASVLVDQDTTAPIAMIEPPAVLTCLQPQYILLADGTGDASWTTIGGNIVSGGDQFSNTLIDAPGIYVLSTVDPSNGCIATDTVEVTANQQAPGVAVDPPALLSCQQTTAIISATASGDSLTYQWQTADGQFVSGQNSASPEVDAPGNYSLTVTDGVNGCTNTIDAIVDQDTISPLIAIAPPQIITCTLPEQNIDAQNLTLPGNFTYNWTAAAGGNIVSGQDGLSPAVNAGGDYSLLVTNTVNGCTAEFFVNVQQNTVPPVANAGPNDTLTCNLSTLTINGSGSGTGALNYSWTSANGGNIVSGQNSATPVVDAPGVYNLLVVNTVNGCSAIDSVEILNDLNAPQADAGPGATLTCTLSQTTLSGAASTGANFQYSWTSANGGNIVSGAGTLSPLIDAPGTYTLQVVNNSNGCVALSEVIILEDVATPPAGVSAPGILTCAVTSLPLSGAPVTGAYTWSWVTTDGNIVSGANTPNPVIDAPGAYTLVVTSLQNGCSAAAYSVVSEDVAVPVINAAAPQILTCTDLTVPVNGSVTQPASGYQASWSTSDGMIVSGANLLNATANAPGTYILTVTNQQNGCTSTAQAVVDQNVVPPVAQATAPQTITCANTSVALSGTGSSAGANYTYNWSGGPILSGQGTLMPTAGAAGTYTLLVTDLSNGCTSTVAALLPADTLPPVAAIASPGLITCIQTDITLDAGASSQGVDFVYSWSTNGGQILNGQNTLSPLVGQPGGYTLLIENLQNGCTATAQTAVTEDITPPDADAGSAATLHCNQPSTSLAGSSTTPGSMNYSWTTPDGNFITATNIQTPEVDAPGTYTLLVTNPANGCSNTDSVIVAALPPPAFEPEVLQPNCHRLKGTVNFGAITGGMSPYLYSSNGGQTFSGQSTVQQLQAGSYDLVVQDVNGCTAETTVIVNTPFIPEVKLEDFVLIELGESVLLDPVLNMPDDDVASWIWTPADGLSCADCPRPEAKPLKPAQYTLTVVDSNGCEAKATIRILVDRKRFLYAPNIFSPNDDGINDMFTLYAKGVTDIQRLQVFDRWGAEVFMVEHLQPNDELHGWNGTFRGHDLNPAVFVWQAVVEFEDGAVEVFSGDITLVR